MVRAAPLFCPHQGNARRGLLPQIGHWSPKRFRSAAVQIGRRLRQRRGRLRRDNAAGKMPAAGRKGLESRRKTVKHTARRSNDRFGFNSFLSPVIIRVCSNFPLVIFYGSRFGREGVTIGLSSLFLSPFFRRFVPKKSEMLWKDKDCGGLSARKSKISVLQKKNSKKFGRYGAFLYVWAHFVFTTNNTYY